MVVVQARLYGSEACEGARGCSSSKRLFLVIVFYFVFYFVLVLVVAAMTATALAVMSTMRFWVCYRCRSWSRSRNNGEGSSEKGEDGADGGESHDGGLDGAKAGDGGFLND